MKLFKGKQDEGGGPAVAEIMPAETLDQVQAEITKLQGERSGLEGQSRGYSEWIAAIDHESVALKEKLAAGDVSVTPILDQLDRRRTESNRKLDGIRYSIVNLDGRMVRLARRARELAQVADAERQDREVAAFQETTEKLSKQIIGGWKTACVDAYKLSTLVDETISTGNLDANHKQAVLTANEKLNELFHRESLRPVNEAWVRRESHLYRRMQIVAARPK